MKKLTMCGAPFTPEQMNTIRGTLEGHGYSLQVLERGADWPEDILRDSEILMGYFPPEYLRNAAEFRWYQLPCAGVDAYCPDSNYDGHPFTLTNISGVFGAVIAEQLVMGTLMLLRRMPEYSRQQQGHIWNRPGDLGFLCNSRVTILGTGNIGGTFARYIKAMGAAVIGVNTRGEADEAFDQVYPLSRLSEALAEADLVAACLPLTDQTLHLLDRTAFAAMKKGAYFMNVGRGKTVCQPDLIEALASGHLKGAMLDVFEEEPLSPDSPLWDMDGVILTPHISGHGDDPRNRQMIYDIFMDNLHRYFAGEPLKNTVDRKKGY